MKKTSRHKKFSNGVWVNVRAMEETLRKATARRDELSLWGLNNLCIQFQIKCRLTEKVIEQAQKCQIKSDADSEAELNRLKRLRRQTYKDLHSFVRKREEHHWRNWDHILDGSTDIRAKSKEDRFAEKKEIQNAIENEEKDLELLERSYK